MASKYSQEYVSLLGQSGILVNPDNGSIRFSAKGIKEFGPMFKKANIPIECIRTIDEFVNAQNACSGVFMELLVEEMEQDGLREDASNNEKLAIEALILGFSGDEDAAMAIVASIK